MICQPSAALIFLFSFGSFSFKMIMKLLHNIISFVTLSYFYSNFTNKKNVNDLKNWEAKISNL